MDCPGSCNVTYRRAFREYRQALAEWDGDGDGPEVPDIASISGEPVWCFRCAATVRRCLASLEDLAAIRAAQADGHRGGQNERVSGSPGKPSPSPAIDDLEELWSVLHGWELSYRGADPRKRDKRLPVAIMTAVSWLLLHFDMIIRHPDIAPEFGRDVLRWHAELSRKTAMGEVRRKPVPCPRCDLMALVQKPDEEYVVCEQCGRHVSPEEYDELALKSAQKIKPEAT